MTYAQKQRVLELIRLGYGVPVMRGLEAVFPGGERVDHLGVKHDKTYKP